MKTCRKRRKCDERVAVVCISRRRDDGPRGVELREDQSRGGEGIGEGEGGGGEGGTYDGKRLSDPAIFFN